MFSNSQAREEYKLLQLDVKIEYPSNELDIISSIVTNYSNDESMLTNFEVVKELRELEKYSEIVDYAHSDISVVYHKAFIDRIKGNIDKCNDMPLIEYEDSKQAFISYISGNMKALINSNNEYKFTKWNGKAWVMLTDEESKIIYNDFIKQCEIELKKIMPTLEKSDYSKMIKKVRGWDNKNRVNEALDKLKRDKAHIINLKYHNRKENILCSKNGMIIDLNTGEIKSSQRNDLILNTSKYNLVDKEESIKFVNEKLKLYQDVLGEERLNFILDLIAYKMLGKNLQLAIFMIGAGATGKSTF